MGTIVIGQHGPDTRLQRRKLFVDDGDHRQWVNVTQVVMHENITKAADFPPGYIRVGRLEIFQ